MFDLTKIARENILNLLPYSSARDEFSGEDGIFLDANENPYGNLNRYPDPFQKALKKRIGEVRSISSEQIFIGNGSDEVIDILFRIFCNPGKDKALTFSPTYGMYDVSAAINDVELVKVPLDAAFAIDLDAVLPVLKDENLKLVFICSPNNPTGNSLSLEAIETILQNCKGIVLIDEAYIDFSSQASLVNLINKYDNLVVSQTFSKAWGLAAARVGIAFTNKAILNLMNKVKPPYNVSALNQQAALDTLNNTAQFDSNLESILQQKEMLKAELEQLDIVEQVYPSDANFFLVKVNDADGIYAQLVADKIIVRNRNKVVNNCIRITVGTAKENNTLINGLKKLEK